MKKTLIAAALVLFTGSALAEQNAVLQVQGKLTAASCTPELSNGGVIDYGYIHLSTLSPTEVNPLGFKDIELAINCTAPTKVAWTSADNETDSQPSPPINVITTSGSMASPPTYQAYGVGKTEDGVAIGNYAFFTDQSPTYDGNVGSIIYHNPDWGSARWSAGPPSLRNDGYSLISVASPDTLEPIAFSRAVFKLSATLSIKDTTSLNIKDDTELKGQATFTLRYL
ncbi:TPA: DUF1120 domain-containing protein [Klebsiella michiganensis]|nr:DUF1120 domain-containing protein [Klebsiella michiganensis]